jgi:DNA-binding NarL/FixJ family response regulator
MKREKRIEGQETQVVLFEDHPVFASLIQHCAKEAYEVKEIRRFAAGLPGIEYLETLTSPPDLVLVDIGLPDVSGTVVISAFREKFPQTRILVISAIASENIVLDAIRSGASGYILKDDPEIAIIDALMQVRKGLYPLSPSLAGFLFRLAGARLPPNDISSLSQRELEVLKLIAAGKTYKETASALDVGLSTIQMHVRNLYRKLGVHSQTQAIIEGRKQRLIN